MCRSAYIEVFGASSANESFSPDDEDLSDDSDGLDVLSEDQLATQGWLQPGSASRDADTRDGDAFANFPAGRLVKAGEVYRQPPPKSGIILIEGVERKQNADDDLWWGTSVADGVSTSVTGSTSELGERTNHVRVSTYAISDDDEIMVLDLDYVVNPSLVELVVDNSNRIVAVACTARSFSCFHRDADEDSWHVAGRGDIWVLRVSVTNTNPYPIRAELVRDQLVLRAADGSLYPSLTGKAFEKLQSLLDSPRELGRFGYYSPPLLPRMETTGLLAYLVPRGGGEFGIQGLYARPM